MVDLAIPTALTALLMNRTLTGFCTMNHCANAVGWGGTNRPRWNKQNRARGAVFDVRAALFALLGNDLTQIKASAHIRAQVHRRVRNNLSAWPSAKHYLLALPGAEQQDFGWQGALVAHAPLPAAGKRRS